MDSQERLDKRQSDSKSISDTSQDCIVVDKLVKIFAGFVLQNFIDQWNNQDIPVQHFQSSNAEKLEPANRQPGFRRDES